MDAACMAGDAYDSQVREHKRKNMNLSCFVDMETTTLFTSCLEEETHILFICQHHMSTF